jgi:D-sedoheptulose 7-phosphate isomerase
MIREIRAQFAAHQSTMALLEEELAPQIARAAEMMVTLFREGKKVLVMGNGGSAADAQHLAAEIIGRFKLERRALPAIALTTDSSILTAVGNDYGFDNVFSRQVEGLATAGDLVIGISTSGNSANVLAALTVAGQIGCRTMGLLGRDGGAIGKIVQFPLTVPSTDTPRIQEGHITMIHILCDLVEKGLFAPVVQATAP